MSARTITKGANTKVGALLDYVIDKGCTPDMPVLRYKGPQLVFLWDRMLMPSEWRLQLGLDKEEDCHVKHWRCITKDTFIPLITSDVSYKVREFLPNISEWPSYLSDNYTYFKTAKACGVRGRVASVSLKALARFDKYYSNTITSYRLKRTVRIDWSGNGNLGEVQAWVYLTPFQLLTKYNPHTQRYRFPDGFDPQLPTKNLTNPKVPAWDFDSLPLSGTGGRLLN